MISLQGQTWSTLWRVAGLSFGFCLGAGDNALHSEARRDYFQSLENDLIGVFSSWYAYSCPKEAKWLGKVEDGQPSVHRLLLFFFSCDVNAVTDKVQWGSDSHLLPSTAPEFRSWYGNPC